MEYMLEDIRDAARWLLRGAAWVLGALLAVLVFALAVAAVGSAASRGASK